jgi:small subunit ribosomal protein S4
MLLTPGDSISVREGSRGRSYFKDMPAVADKSNVPGWLVRDLMTLSGTVQRMPERSEIDNNLNEQLIVEYYSR